MFMKVSIPIQSNRVDLQKSNQLGKGSRKDLQFC